MIKFKPNSYAFKLIVYLYGVFKDTKIYVYIDIIFITMFVYFIFFATIPEKSDDTHLMASQPILPNEISPNNSIKYREIINPKDYNNPITIIEFNNNIGEYCTMAVSSKYPKGLTLVCN